MERRRGSETQDADHLFIFRKTPSVHGTRACENGWSATDERLRYTSPAMPLSDRLSVGSSPSSDEDLISLRLIRQAYG